MPNIILQPSAKGSSCGKALQQDDESVSSQTDSQTSDSLLARTKAPPKKKKKAGLKEEDDIGADQTRDSLTPGTATKEVSRRPQLSVTALHNKRRRNALYSQRKYYKKKEEVERLELLRYQLRTDNHRLRQENEQFEQLLRQLAQALLAAEPARTTSRSDGCSGAPAPRATRIDPTLPQCVAPYHRVDAMSSSLDGLDAAYGWSLPPQQWLGIKTVDNSLWRSIRRSSATTSLMDSPLRREDPFVQELELLQQQSFVAGRLFQDPSLLGTTTVRPPNELLLRLRIQQLQEEEFLRRRRRRIQTANDDWRMRQSFVSSSKLPPTTRELLRRGGL